MFSSPSPGRKPTLTSCPGAGRDPRQGACAGPELCVHQQGVCWWKGLSNLGRDQTAWENRGDSEAAAWPLPGTPVPGSASPTQMLSEDSSHTTRRHLELSTYQDIKGPSLVLLPPRALSRLKPRRIPSSRGVFKAHPSAIFLNVQHLAAGGPPGAAPRATRCCELPRTQDESQIVSEH